ncbi:DUF1294 domain-containing protein [Agromyces lapidis]|uniref:DUF1294 domain-containing protein n=1 Tax=Agromyces lapidis TaxID=279574 RepID=A0ABV5SSM0_9MICO|nr:DUF1294 domain-containing protein [Agromyces lapidis]
MAGDSRTVPRGPSRAAQGDRDLSRPLPATLSWGVLVGFALVLLGALVLAAVPWWVGAWYGGLSIVAFAAYGIDKAAARRGAGRVPERTLHLVDLVGGWPGALAAQQLFRHKTRKRRFRRVFWAGVVGNLLALAAFVVWLGASR